MGYIQTAKHLLEVRLLDVLNRSEVGEFERIARQETCTYEITMSA